MFTSSRCSRNVTNVRDYPGRAVYVAKLSMKEWVGMRSLNTSKKVAPVGLSLHVMSSLRPFDNVLVSLSGVAIFLEKRFSWRISDLQ